MVKMGSNPVFPDLILNRLMQKIQDLTPFEPLFNHRYKYRPGLCVSLLKTRSIELIVDSTNLQNMAGFNYLIISPYIEVLQVNFSMSQVSNVKGLRIW